VTLLELTPRPAIRASSAAGEEAPAAATSSDPESCPLSLRSLTKCWGQAVPPVLAGLDLDLEPGTLTWVGGRNGAGKTTMLRVAAGLIEPDTGSATVWGLTVRRHRTRYQQLVSFLPAGDRGLYARLTVRHQLEFWARISMLPANGMGKLVQTTIAAFALEELANQRVDRMSMGQRQRLRVAMTFMTGARVVLLDEPLTSLDVESAALVLGAVERVREGGGAVLWCSPTGEQPVARLDASWVLEAGRLVPA
jgi:ABC-2 type transport system ATP-binding protein